MGKPITDRFGQTLQQNLPARHKHELAHSWRDLKSEFLAQAR
jgi:hypothetical protein